MTRSVTCALGMLALYSSLSRRPRLGDTRSMRDMTRSALVARPPALLYRLVEEVERYPEFVPGCSAAQVLERDGNQMLARLLVPRGLVGAEFITGIRLDPAQT